jgi:hypothetical protein
MYAVKSMTKHGQACIKEEVNGFEISLAFDSTVYQKVQEYAGGINAG